MNPLSILNYYKNNKKRFYSVFIAITLSVFLIYIVQMIIYSSFRIGYYTSVEPKKYFSTIFPKGSTLSEGFVQSLTHLEGVESIRPCVIDYTTLSTGIGSVFSSQILSLRYEDIQFIMSKSNLILISGHLPEKDGEIILHKQVAANKALKIGDFIGRMLSKNESLPGAYKIVGIVDGKSILSFANINTYLNTYPMQSEYMYGCILIPENNSLTKMNTILDAMSPSNFQTSTLNSETIYQKTYTSKINALLTLIITLIILIVSTCIGFLCYIHFSERRYEFGLLWAIGFSKQRVINKAFAEINGINILGFLCGILLSLTTGLLLNLIYFIPIGDPLQIINIRYILGAACSPIFVTLFSVVPIWKMLKSLDPISIIEGGM